MLINVIEIKKYTESWNNIVARVSITIDNLFAIHDMKLIKEDGLLLAMPSRRTKVGKYKDIIHPISEQGRKSLEKLVFPLYERALSKTATSISFIFTNTDVADILEQNADDFEIAQEFNGNYFVSEDLRKAIEAWGEE